MDYKTVPSKNFVEMVAMNVDNHKLSDEEFRNFIRNTLDIVDFDDPRKPKEERCENCFSRCKVSNYINLPKDWVCSDAYWPNGEIMTRKHPYKKETISLIETLGKHGWVVFAVDDGDGVWQLITNESEDEIVEMIVAVDECWVRVAKPDLGHGPNGLMEATLFIVFGNDPGELVCDFSCKEEVHPLMDVPMDEHYKNWS